MNEIIAYKGQLTLKVMHGNKVVRTVRQHNRGTLHLMRFLSLCLGSRYNELDAPRYIRAFYTDEDGMNTSKEVTTRPVATNFTPEFSEPGDDVACVSLTFLIPSNAVDPTSSTINRFALYSANNSDAGSKDNYMAWVGLPKASQENPGQPESITVHSGESLMVIWEMTLQNVATE